MTTRLTSLLLASIVWLLTSGFTSDYVVPDHPECLGVYAHLNISLSDDTDFDGNGVYEIPHTPGPMGPYMNNNGFHMSGDVPYFNCMGPGRPYVVNNTGTPYLHIYLLELGTYFDAGATTQTFDIGIPANQWVDGRQPFYILKLNVRK